MSGHTYVITGFVTSIMLVLVLQGISWTEDLPAIHPYPHRTIDTETVQRWTFETSEHRWQSINDVQIETEAGQLNITSTGTDPYIHAPEVNVEGPVTVHLTMRSDGGGSGELFWTTAAAPDWDPARKTEFSMRHDNEVHRYRVALPVDGTLTRFRLDPGSAPGSIQLHSVTVIRRIQHPLTIEQVRVKDQSVEASIHNHRDSAVTFSSVNDTHTVEPRGQTKVSIPLSKRKAFETVRVRVKPTSAPPLQRLTVVHHPNREEDWTSLRRGSIELLVAADGSGARILREGKLVALLAPLVEHQPLKTGRSIPDLTVRKGANQISVEGARSSIEFRMDKHSVRYNLTAGEEVGGPVVRAVGSLEQGLLPGVEYLGEGERSSARIDIKTQEHLRYAPDPYEVTMPLMSFVTSEGSVAMTWRDMSNQPVYATPNFFEGTQDHRMNLVGRRIEAAVRIGSGWQNNDRLVDAITWTVNQHGLPEPSDPPRSPEDQKELCLEAYHGPLNGGDGWGHGVNPDKYPRKYYADYVSSIWRLTGDIPEVPHLVPGGAHIANPASFFVTNRLKQWKQHIAKEAQSLKDQQRDDGSFRYDGKYREGHFENTASGYCARKAYTLLNHAWYTGDASSLRAGRKALEFMTRFRTPRGAQIWEVPLHTPDLLASAYLVKAYTRGYQLTGDETYLDHARRWAFTGFPFVYQWSDQPIMKYSTIPVYGATNWTAPIWIGMPVQWCGTVYADGLLTLSEVDESFNWEKVARGIAMTAEHMQFTEGEYVGTLPDYFELRLQRRHSPIINPGALVSLRMRLRGRIDDLDVATGNAHRVVAPFPVSIRNGQAIIQSKNGVDYQVLVDGEHVVNVSGTGRDSVSLGD